MKDILGSLLVFLLILQRAVSEDDPASCNLKVPSDREVLQIISLSKDLQNCPNVNITITSTALRGTILFPINGNPSTILPILQSSDSIVLVVMGFVISPDTLVVKNLLEELKKQGNLVITIAVDYDNIINLLQAILPIAKALDPLVKLIPAKKTTIIGIDAGVHLGAAVIGGLRSTASFKKIIGLDPVLPLLETDIFLQLLVGRSKQILIIHSSAGSYKPSILFPPLVLSGAVQIYIGPGDLAKWCGVGPSQYICRKGLSLKLMLDVLLGRLLAVRCDNIKVLNFFAPQKCQGSGALAVTLDVSLIPNKIYYAILAPLAKRGGVTGLLNDVLGLVSGLLDAVLGKPMPKSHAVPVLVRDLVVTVFSNVLCAGIVPCALDSNLDVVLVVEVGGKLHSDVTLATLTETVGSLLDTLLGDVAGIVDDLGGAVGGLLDSLGLGSLGGLVDNLLQGVAVLVDYLACQLDSLVSGLGPVLSGVVGGVLDAVGALLGGTGNPSGGLLNKLLGGKGIVGGLLGGGGVGGLVGGLLGGGNDTGLLGGGDKKGLLGGVLGGNKGGVVGGVLDAVGGVAKAPADPKATVADPESKAPSII